MNITIQAGLRAALLGVLAVTGTAQEQAPEQKPDFANTASTIQSRLEAGVAELSALRETITAETLPLSRELSALETELLQVRDELNRATRTLDGRSLDLRKLGDEIERRQGEVDYLSTLLSDYLREFESRLHVVEVQRYEAPLEAARLALENTSLSQEEVFAAQAELLATSLARLHDVAGGSRFDGQAVDPSGLVKQGSFVHVGPVAVFRSADGAVVGSAEQRLGSFEPTVIEFGRPEDADATRALLDRGAALLPLDPTLGNAHKIEATEETFLEHVEKGGAVMIPIFVMAGLALLIALVKWAQLSFVRNPSRRKIAGLLEAVRQEDEEAAAARAAAIPGPAGRMLVAGVEHIREPRELIEEIMYERVMETRLSLQRWLPFIAICAASAPLLGLLGTVTGIINTFKLITVFGSGDVKSLSGGISEALITTKFGLIVAIPSLLLHAFLSRKARGIVGRMETAAVAFANQVSKSDLGRRPEVLADGRSVTTVPDPKLVRAQVTEILGELLGPLGVGGANDHQLEKERPVSTR